MPATDDCGMPSITNTGTAGPLEFRAFPFIAKARADAVYSLPGPFPKGDALLDRGRHAAGEFRIGVVYPTFWICEATVQMIAELEDGTRSMGWENLDELCAHVTR